MFSPATDAQHVQRVVAPLIVASMARGKVGIEPAHVDMERRTFQLIGNPFTNPPNPATALNPVRESATSLPPVAPQTRHRSPGGLSHIYPSMLVRRRRIDYPRSEPIERHQSRPVSVGSNSRLERMVNPVLHADTGTGGASANGHPPVMDETLLGSDVLKFHIIET